MIASHSFARCSAAQKATQALRAASGEPAALGGRRSPLERASGIDESWQKLPFYAAHDVDEVLIVDPEKRSVHWLTLANGEYRDTERSALIELGPNDLAAQIHWP